MNDYRYPLNTAQTIYHNQQKIYDDTHAEEAARGQAVFVNIIAH